MIYTTLTLPGDNNVYLREKNPYQKFIKPDYWFGVIKKDWSEFEAAAITAKKILINPVEGKTEYDRSDVEPIVQIWIGVKNEWITIEEYPGAYKGYERRQAFEYMGKEEKGLNIEKLEAEIDELIKNSTAEDYLAVIGKVRKPDENVNGELLSNATSHLMNVNPFYGDEEEAFFDGVNFGYNWQKKNHNGLYTQSEVLTLLKKMKELCAERAATKIVTGFNTDIGRVISWEKQVIDKQSILSINENELLK